MTNGHCTSHHGRNQHNTQALPPQGDATFFEFSDPHSPTDPVEVFSSSSLSKSNAIHNGYLGTRKSPVIEIYVTVCHPGGLQSKWFQEGWSLDETVVIDPIQPVTCLKIRANTSFNETLMALVLHFGHRPSCSSRYDGRLHWPKQSVAHRMH